MVINGKDRGFRYNVWASGKIAKLTASGEIKSVVDDLQNDARAAEMLPQVAIIMNTAFERHKHNRAVARGEDYAMDILTVEEVEDLTILESTELLREVFRVMKEDSTGEVETEPIKTGKKTAKAEKGTESR